MCVPHHHGVHLDSAHDTASNQGAQVAQKNLFFVLAHALVDLDGELINVRRRVALCMHLEDARESSVKGRAEEVTACIFTHDDAQGKPSRKWTLWAQKLNVHTYHRTQSTTAVTQGEKIRRASVRWISDAELQTVAAFTATNYLASSDGLGGDKELDEHAGYQNGHHLLALRVAPAEFARAAKKYVVDRARGRYETASFVMCVHLPGKNYSVWSKYDAMHSDKRFGAVANTSLAHHPSKLQVIGISKESSSKVDKGQDIPSPARHLKMPAQN